MRGYVYMIESASAGLRYYGSTKQALTSRMSGHRRDFKRWKNGKHNYTTSFQVIENPDARIMLVETVEYQDKQELIAREGHYIRENECVNKVIPNRTKQEYYQDNTEKRKEKQKQWYQDNAETIKEKKKQYNQANADKIKQQKSQPVTCPTCGAQVRKGEISKHNRTTKHSFAYELYQFIHS